jgi:hypothetical protein
MKFLLSFFPLIAVLNGQVFIDSDSDSLDDSWELTYFLTLETTTGSANPDADGLDNLAEQTVGTNPTKADTDDDGLQDHLETGYFHLRD